MKFSKFLVLSSVFLSVFTMGCSTTPCKIEDRPVTKTQEVEKSMTVAKDLTNKVRIYKPDGSQQCGTSPKTDVKQMQKELGLIQVFSAENKHDGLMRIQMCGHPTGNCNVFEILSSDLDAALKLGFKKWIRN